MIKIDDNVDSLTYNCIICGGQWQTSLSDFYLNEDSNTGIIEHTGKCLFCDNDWLEAIKDIYTAGENNKSFRDKINSIHECFVYSWNRFISKLKLTNNY